VIQTQKGRREAFSLWIEVSGYFQEIRKCDMHQGSSIMLKATVAEREIQEALDLSAQAGGPPLTRQ